MLVAGERLATVIEKAIANGGGLSLPADEGELNLPTDREPAQYPDSREMGRRGGLNRAKHLTAERRREIAILGGLAAKEARQKNAEAKTKNKANDND